MSKVMVVPRPGLVIVTTAGWLLRSTVPLRKSRELPALPASPAALRGSSEGYIHAYQRMVKELEQLIRWRYFSVTSTLRTEAAD